MVTWEWKYFENHYITPFYYRTDGLSEVIELHYYLNVTQTEVLFYFSGGYKWDQLKTRNINVASEFLDAKRCNI